MAESDDNVIVVGTQSCTEGSDEVIELMEDDVNVYVSPHQNGDISCYSNNVDGHGHDRRRSRSPHSRSRSPERSMLKRRHVNANTTRVVVRNMPYEMKWQDIKDLFRKEVGDVAYVEMIEASDGKPRGTAIIEFKDRDMASRAIEMMHQYKVHDRLLVVNEEREKDRRTFQAIGHIPGGAARNMRSGPMMGGGMPRAGVIPGMPGVGIGAGMPGVGIGAGMPGVGIGAGMPGVGIGAGIPGGRMCTGMPGVGVGAGFKGTGIGVGMPGVGMGGGMSGIGVGAGTVVGPGVPGAGFGVGVVGAGVAGIGAGGISPEVLAQLGIDGPITNTVFVANLDYKVTRQKLIEVFKLAGNVISVEMKEDKNGKFRGMGIVMFEQSLEAVQAVSMFNNQSLYDRKMVVRIDKMHEEPVSAKSKLPSGLKSIGLGLGVSGLGGVIGGSSSAFGVRGSLGGSALSAGGLGLRMDSALGSGNLGLAGMSGLGSGCIGPGFGGANFGSLGFGSGPGGLGIGTMPGLGIDGLGVRSMDANMIAGNLRYGSLPGDRTTVRHDERQSRYTRPDNCTVLVKNLPYSVTWQELRQHFVDSGDVKYAEIRQEKGRSIGQGLVRFSSEENAQHAISLTVHCRRVENVCAISTATLEVWYTEFFRFGIAALYLVIVVGFVR